MPKKHSQALKKTPQKSALISNDTGGHSLGKRNNKTASTQELSQKGPSRFTQGENSTFPTEIPSRWFPIAVTAKAVLLGASTLRALQRDGQLIGGKHWVYLNGKRNGPVGWDPQAIAEWQSEQTQKVIASQKQSTTEKAAAIELFDEPDAVTPIEAGA